jgi:8-oxo-dGTP pyrophosphatase MutT (NUDIX family)
VIAAAGGVVVRDGLVLVVHRPRYDDWSLPKGKRDPGETDEACALREVEEETGLRCALGEPLGTSEYVDHHGRPKVVRWWRMSVVQGEFTPGDEVDAVRWLPVEEAAALLTYDRDREVLARL